jgi:beta-ureidopropionase
MVKNTQEESNRKRRVVKIGLIQNTIVSPTNVSINEQYESIKEKIGKMVETAGKLGVNVLSLQETWTMPFAFCTRERLPWTQFAGII